MDDKYCYKGTDVLINKFNIRDQEQLDKFERELTRFNLVKIEADPVKGEFNIKHLQKIHAAIFKDIYPFAGEFRTVDISKNFFTFASSSYIVPEANKLFKELKSDKFLVGSSLEHFSDRAAYYMAELNVLHPFREGNGRTQREFIRTLAYNSGYLIDWSRVDINVLLEASKNSVIDTRELTKAISNTIYNDSPIKELIKSLTFDRSIER